MENPIAWHSPLGKHTPLGKGAHSQDTPSKLEAENRYLKQQIEVLKKYKELEREWYQKLY